MQRRVVTGGRARRRAQVVARCCALASLVMVAACSGGGTDDPASAKEPETSSSAPGSPSGQAGDTGLDTGLDPALAVPAPGPLVGRLESADLMISAPQTISAEMVAAIRKLKGVTSVLQVSLAQVPVEGKALNVLAVDPASYRRYTPPGTAGLQDVWDRVAGGELAVPPDTPKTSIDAGGYVQLGSAAGSPDIHVGAYAPQVESIDAVVNEKWGAKLDMTPGNALIVSTGITSPSTVEKPLAQLLGGDSGGDSVQALDAVARFGLDPGAAQTAVVVGSIGDAVGTYRYTVLGGGRIAPDPAWVAAHISTETVPILGSVTCNTAIFPQLKAALTEVIERGLADKIHPSEYAGCFYPRFIAGSDRLSNHAFGLALDLNTPGNQRGTVGQMDRGVVDAFKNWGFAWGGDWGYTDPMHFEMARLVNPG